MSGVLCVVDKRKLRVRSKLRLCNKDKLRLCVVKTNRHLYIQLIDDKTGNTVVSVTTNTNIFRQSNVASKTWCNMCCASRLSDFFRDKAKEKNVDLADLPVYFDRGSAPYTGVIKVVADKLRECGVKF